MRRFLEQNKGSKKAVDKIKPVLNHALQQMAAFLKKHPDIEYKHSLALYDG